jgi:predicted AlkP superfamily phosphohydrolase/phosphomutase
MLSNSVAAGTLAASYVLILVLQLNPRLSLDPAALAPLVMTTGLFYVVHLTALCYVILVVWQLLAPELFSPAWISVGVLSWLGAGAAALGAALMAANLRTFELVIEPETARALGLSAPALGVSSAFFVLVGLARRHSERRLVGLWAALLVLIAVGSIAVPLVARGPARTPPLEARPLDTALDTPAWDRLIRVTIVAIDAGSLELVANATAQGRLPNFGRILDTGAVMHLATLSPTSAEAVWTAVATGKLPQKNGVRSAGIYRSARGGDPLRLLPDYCFARGLVRFGLLTEEPHSSATVRTRTLWSILGTFGLSVGVINWPLTYPAPVIRGFVVSDVYSRLALTTSGLDDPGLLYPRDLQAEALPIVQKATFDRGAVPADGGFSLGRHQLAGQTDRAYDQLAQTLGATRPAHVTIVRYASLDPIGHYFLRYAAPSEFGDVTEEERRRFGAVLESHYALIDEAIGRAMAGLGPDDLLLVVSGYGMEPLGLAKRLLERVIGDPEVSGSHEMAPDGFLMAYGAAVARITGLTRGSVVDVLPTVLYFLGLPVGRDMDGRARTDLFQPAFVAERPITFIPTHER